MRSILLSIGFFLCCSLLVPSLAHADSESAGYKIKEQLDCVNVFNVLASLAAPSCPVKPSAPNRGSEIDAAIALLAEHKLLARSAFDGLDITFCPLNFGLGLVPAPKTIFLDDGLRAGSIETLAEVLVHELEHVVQMRTMGVDDFKCGYINALVDCGGCFDDQHPLEAPAYKAQAEVRDYLLEKWLQRSGEY
ncbi:MAG: hypothetical protein ACU84Q_16000 [Gammaproteobacteria bacterium]